MRIHSLIVRVMIAVVEERETKEKAEAWIRGKDADKVQVKGSIYDEEGPPEGKALSWQPLVRTKGDDEEENTNKCMIYTFLKNLRWHEVHRPTHRQGYSKQWETEEKQGITWANY